MRSEAVDRLVSTYLRQPVAVSWNGSLADPLRGRLRDARVTLAGAATAWISFDEVVLGADHVEVTPGLPARIAARRPHVEVALGQAQVDAWIARFRLPFALRLEADGLMMRPGPAGLPSIEFRTRLVVSRGWFVLQPLRTGPLGVPEWVGAMLRTYLPLPPIGGQARIASIRHAPGRLWIDLEADDFEEELTPGLVGRLRARLVPFARAGPEADEAAGPAEPSEGDPAHRGNERDPDPDD